MTTVNVVMLVRDRPELTRQAVMTMLTHADTSLRLVIVDDGSDRETCQFLESVAKGPNYTVSVLRLLPPRGIVGLLRNLGILASERLFGRSDYLYLADNDAIYLPGWLDTLITAFQDVERHGFRLIGGYTHPYHGVNKLFPVRVIPLNVGAHDAVQGLSHLMRWKTWNDFGPFDAHAQGIGQSEDFAFCRRIVEAGYLVGSVYPRVILNCGLLDSYGKPCVGYDAVKSELEGEIRARGLEGKVYYPTVGEKAASA